jgi:hypothetical protein
MASERMKGERTMDQRVRSEPFLPALRKRSDGQLCLATRGATTPVRIARCFPWSARSKFISLRDDERNELWLIEDPVSLDPATRSVLEEALVEADFVLEIETIDKIGEEIEIRCWDVQTTQGPRRFQTKRDEWPRIMPGGSVLVRDVAGDLYLIRDPDGLDRKSRETLSVFID